MELIKRNRSKISIIGLLLVLLGVTLFSLTIGHVRLYYDEVLQGLYEGARYLLFNEPIKLHPTISTILLEEYLPRALAGVLVGASLAVSGGIYQGIFRNPMVSPDFLGATTGAGFGAAIAIALGLGSTAIMLNSFMFGLLAVSIAYFTSLRTSGNPQMTLLLAGIMVSALFDSALTYLEATVDQNSTLPNMTFWLMGSLVNKNFYTLSFVFPFMLVGFIALLFLRWPVNLLTMGEDEARTMGISTKLIRGIAIVAATLITAASVSICGKIGWIGLVIPHFSRMLVGHDYRILLPTSMLMGASFLMATDIVARYWGTEQPLGMITAFIGAPFFLYLILSRRYRM